MVAENLERKDRLQLSTIHVPLQKKDAIETGILKHDEKTKGVYVA